MAQDSSEGGGPHDAAPAGAFHPGQFHRLGDAPDLALGNLMVAVGMAMSNAAHNATNAQLQGFVTAQAATTAGVTTLYALDTASTGVATAPILKG